MYLVCRLLLEKENTGFGGGGGGGGGGFGPGGPGGCTQAANNRRVDLSFPTRRSSDLRGACRPARGRRGEGRGRATRCRRTGARGGDGRDRPARGDRKSTRLNSSHRCTSYAVFCLKKKTPVSAGAAVAVAVVSVPAAPVDALRLLTIAAWTSHSLHDALPISVALADLRADDAAKAAGELRDAGARALAVAMDVTDPRA